MPQRSALPTTRRVRPQNFGDFFNVAGGQQVAVCNPSNEQSGPMAIYVECSQLIVPSGLLGTADFRLLITCDWGAGGASTVSTFDCTYRQRIPIVGGQVTLSAWIAAFPYFNARTPVGSFYVGGLGGANGALVAPATVQCKGRVFAAEGSDAVSKFPTFWMTQQGVAAGVYMKGQGRLATFKCWADVSGDDSETVFLQLFDQATLPVNPNVPFDSTPLTIGGGVVPEQKRLVQGQTRGFVNGLAWALSTTPFVCTPTTGAEAAFTTAEFET